MKDFIQEVVQDIQLAIPKLDCTVGESRDTITISCSVGDSPLENTSYTKDGDTESMLKMIIAELSELISDTEPNGIVVEPKIDCEFKVSDPFFDNLDDCSGGMYPSYTMKDCARVVGRVAKYLSAIGILEIEHTNLKNGIYIRLHNRDSDIRLSLRVGTINKSPALIMRFGDYRNFKVVTQVVDGASVDGKMNFMAIEFINTIIPHMIELATDLIVKRHQVRIQSERIVEKLFRELGWRSPKKKEKDPTKD